MDHEQRPALMELITKLLDDRSTMVLGAAVQALMEVCPERLDLINQVYHRSVTESFENVREYSDIPVISHNGLLS